MSAEKRNTNAIPRRDFLKKTVVSAGVLGAGETLYAQDATETLTGPNDGSTGACRPQAVGGKKEYNSRYVGPYLNRVAFPMGGMGAGMICLEGSGALSHVSIRHKPEMFNEPMIFAAIGVKGHPEYARVLEGPVPDWKIFGAPESALGRPHTTYGLPRYRDAAFDARFPFATLELSDKRLPLAVTVTGWSPFEPGDADSACLPVCALEYEFVNNASETLDAVFSFNAANFMAADKESKTRKIERTKHGFVLIEQGVEDKPWTPGAFCAQVIDPATRVNAAWFRGGFWDSLTMAWKDVETAAAYDRPPVTEGDPAPGASLFVPFTLKPGQKRTFAVQMSWFVGTSHLRYGEALGEEVKDQRYCGMPSYKAWYTGQFRDVHHVADHWRDHYDQLRTNSQRFCDCFYDSTLPPEVIEAVSANLCILKSPTVLRELDGKMWGWEGCRDCGGCCYGSCTHVWNYAQSIPHLFPQLERTFRETELEVSQNEEGHQAIRTPIPIRPSDHKFHAAADGQLGGIMQVYREWRISGDERWLRKMWPYAKASLDYCSRAWDPKSKGVLEEPHHNTYDIEFWGPDGMCTSIYLGALTAAIKMGKALAEEVSRYEQLLDRGQKAMHGQLYNGEYFIQKIVYEGLQAENPLESTTFDHAYSPEARELFRKEGPKYQYGNGCLSDGVLGAFLALACGVGEFLDRDKVVSHLESVHRYNFKEDLSTHANPQRPSYACGSEGGLILCTWPKGDALSLPFVYSNEVWTGIEYQVAAHLMMMGRVDMGLQIVRACRDRYDGQTRNPFNEYECGHFYARAMSSYALLQALSGSRYDAVEKKLYVEPSIKGDFRSFLATQDGYGTVVVKNGKAAFEPAAGKVDIREIVYRPKV